MKNLEMKSNKTNYNSKKNNKSDNNNYNYKN